jgi:hypothetical protein
MKVVVIGGTGLIGSKVPENAEHPGEIRFSDWLAQSATT